MVDEWDENIDFSQQPTSMSSFQEEAGRSYGKGRGFIVHNNNDDDWDGGKQNGGWKERNDNSSSGIGTFDASSNWDENNGASNFESSGNNRSRGGSRGGGRGGRGGNRGGGRGGYRNYEDSEQSNYNDYGYNDDVDAGTNSNKRYDKYSSGDSGNNTDFKSRGSRDGYNGRGGGGGSRGFRHRDNNGPSDGFDNDQCDFNDDHNDDRHGRNDRGSRGGGRGRGGRGGGFGRDGDGDVTEKPKTEIYIPPDICMDEKSLFENGVQQGINFDKYDQIDVEVSGENPPLPIETFDEAGLRAHVLSNIKKSRYTKPTPVQKHALPIIMSSRDLMACAQTGSGKTAAFVVPIVNMLLEKPRDLTVSSTCEPQVLIVSPTRELTIQIYEQVMKFSAGTVLKTVVAYGGTSVSHQGNRIAAGCDILVATPGRLIDFLSRGRIKFSSIRFLVLDEADRMLDMGFLPDIEKIIDHETMVPTGERQTLMFSATFPNEIQELAKRFLDNYLFLAVGIVGGACTDVEQNFFEVSKYNKRESLKDLMEKESAQGTQKGTLVFVEMKRTADFIAAFLSEKNYPTTSIHGDRLQREREEALSDFKSGRMSILVATAVAARGLDIKNVSHVINYDMPKTIEEYVHRIGRTGRVGNRGRATSFFDPDVDGPITPVLVKILKQAGQPVPDFLLMRGDSSFAPGKSMKFGGEDIRNFGQDNEDELYSQQQSYTAAVEPEENW